MKWLFAVLVALNIIVFGGMVASRVAEKQKTVIAPTVPVVAAPQQELPPPAPPRISASEPAAPDWIETADTAVSEPLDDEVLLADLSKKEKEKEERAAKEKREREKREREEKRKQELAEKEQGAWEKPERTHKDNRAAQCVSGASIALNEDDYHRIKGLLKQWPHAASRTVEKKSRKSGTQSEKSYRVVLPAGNDAVEQLNRLAAKGFSGSLYEGSVSVGVTHSRSAAQVLISRLATAGFSGAGIQEQGGRDADDNDKSLGVSKMYVTFLDVDEKSAQAIQNVVERYGRLSRRPCP